MNKKGITLSPTFLIGLFIGVFLVFTFILVGKPFAEVLWMGDEKNFFEDSMDNLQEIIDNIGINETKESLFFSNGEEWYLFAFDKNFENSKKPAECYEINCLVLCSDYPCTSDNVLLFRELSEHLEIKNTESILWLKSVEKNNYGKLFVINKDDSLWIGTSNL
jgi:hypothetical protein|tara:strand:- start:343 stop:831 length:489 start_codon:yes stop_codon:yes gene_type:complete